MPEREEARLIRLITTHQHGERGECRPVDCETCLANVATALESARREAKRRSVPRSECDLCQEPVDPAGSDWEWVEDGWSLACKTCLAKIRDALQRDLAQARELYDRAEARTQECLREIEDLKLDLAASKHNEELTRGEEEQATLEANRFRAALAELAPRFHSLAHESIDPDTDEYRPEAWILCRTPRCVALRTLLACGWPRTIAAQAPALECRCFEAGMGDGHLPQCPASGGG